MFEGSLVESTPMLYGRNRWPSLVSVLLQAAVAATVILVPMLHPEVLHTGPMKLTVLAPPPLPAPPKPPPSRPHIVTAMSASPSLPSTPQPAAVATTALLRPHGPSVDAPTLPIGLSIGPANPDLAVSLNPGAPSVVVSPAPKAAGPLNISGGVTAGLLIAPIAPVYPQIARITRTEGTVIVQAIISKSGKIESAHVLSGPAMLQIAALEAVRSARYHPYLLNNEPTEVETTISIVFHINN